MLPFLIAIFLYGQVSAKELSPQKASVEGVVFDGAGKAVPGVMVSISTNSTLSGEDGHFRMQSVDPGKRELRFSKNGFNSKRVSYDFAEGQQVRNVVIRLAKLATISGRLFDSNGQPLAGAVVLPLHYAVLERDGRRELMSSIPAITDDRGQFRLFDLRPGRYLLNISSTSSLDPIMFRDTARPTATGSSRIDPFLYPSAGEVSKAAVVEIEDDDVVLPNISLGTAHLGVIRIHVINPPGQPPVSVQVSSILSSPMMTFNGSSYTTGVSPSPAVTKEHLEPSGSFEKDEHPFRPGRYDVVARWTDPDGNGGLLAKQVEFSGADVDIDVVLQKPDGRLTLHAIDETTSSPVSIGIDLRGPAATRFTNQLNVTLRASRGYSDSATTGANGTAELESIASGNYTVSSVSRIPMDSYVASIRQGNSDVLNDGFAVTKEGSTIEIRVRSDGAVFQGSVLDADGSAVSEALVTLLPESATNATAIALYRKTARTDTKGSFEMRGVAPGVYRAYAFSRIDADSFLESESIQQFESRVIRIRFEENGRISANLAPLDLELKR